MQAARLAGETDFAGWRVGARRLRLAGVRPEDAVWRVGEAGGLFDAALPPAPSDPAPFTAPRAFLALAGEVILHRDPARFDLLYRLLWRLKDQPELMTDLSDPDVAAARVMARQVRDAEHKMHAFLRFRRIDDAADPETAETYVAWFEPAHRIVERGVGVFVRRMANLRFSVLTPDVCAHWDGALAFTPGLDAVARPPEDALEEDWRAYFAATFNPARVNPALMTQHMPRRYWTNMPEARLIPQMVARAKGRTEAMVQADPTEPSARVRRRTAAPAGPKPALETASSLPEIAAALQGCRRCALWRDATQAVAGEGPTTAPLMFVGEQPGDLEDLKGRPFVGPAGQLFDRALSEAGVPREAAYVTNAVKHFKHEPRGKRRLHKTPTASEVRACRPWLDRERALVKPRLVVTLGATAASAVFGRAVSVTRERGPAGDLADGATGFVTVHPSYLLRLPDEAAKAEEFGRFVADLKAAYALV
jgi:probable DNA metabolism protein